MTRSAVDGRANNPSLMNWMSAERDVTSDALSMLYRLCDCAFLVLLLVLLGAHDMTALYIGT
eukprot:6865997-Pyramimonas_sp.AAC.1